MLSSIQEMTLAERKNWYSNHPPACPCTDCTRARLDSVRSSEGDSDTRVEIERAAAATRRGHTPNCPCRICRRSPDRQAHQAGCPCPSCRRKRTDLQVASSASNLSNMPNVSHNRGSSNRSNRNSQKNESFPVVGLIFVIVASGGIPFLWFMLDKS